MPKPRPPQKRKRLEQPRREPPPPPPKTDDPAKDKSKMVDGVLQPPKAGD